MTVVQFEVDIEGIGRGHDQSKDRVGGGPVSKHHLAVYSLGEDQGRADG